MTHALKNLSLPLIALCLSACATKLTVVSPPIPNELRTRCTGAIAQPLATGDQYDTARALSQSIRAYRECKVIHDALVDAVEVRETVIQSIQKQLKDQK